MPRSATAKNLLGSRMEDTDSIDTEPGLCLQVPQRFSDKPSVGVYSINTFSV